MSALRDSFKRRFEHYALTEYVTGHDGLWHVTRPNGTIICSMGRAPSPIYVSDGKVFATCVECLVRLWRRTA